MFHGRVKCSKFPAGTGFPYVKAAVLRDTTKWTLHFSLLRCRAYGAVRMYTAGEECNEYICGIELVTGVLMKIAFSGI
jgi:hypothetical protein